MYFSIGLKLYFAICFLSGFLYSKSILITVPESIRDMIKISKDDSIMDIVLKMNESKANELILEFAFWHPVLHNYLSLKILKNKAEPKKIIIVTSDISSKKIGQKLGIQYSIVKDPKFIEEENILKHNFTFFEYLKYEVKNYYRNWVNTIKNNKKVNSLMKYRYSVYNDTFWLSIFFGWFLISLLLFIFIFYFAVNKTYVYITPDIKIETRWANFVFKSADDESIFDNDRVIKLQEYNESVSIKKEFSTTGIAENSTQKASGEIILYNHLAEQIDLKIGTRVRRQDGVEYTITTRSRLSPATTDENGSVIPSETQLSIIAKNHDSAGVFIGSRWNTSSGTTLIIPGLPEELRSKIYAKTLWDVEGWTNIYKRILKEDDIEKAQEILETQLKSEVIKKAKKNIQANNNLNNTHLEVLWVSKAMTYWEANIQLPIDIESGEQIESFTLSGNISVTLYLYDKQLVINKLKKTINDSILQDVEELIIIDKDSLRISNVIYSLDTSVEIKATSQVEILLRHNFLNPDDVFVQRLKDKIIWVDKKQAEIVLRNTEKIEDARIENRPFFLSEVSNISKNIIFKIESD